MVDEKASEMSEPVAPYDERVNKVYKDALSTVGAPGQDTMRRTGQMSQANRN